MTKTPTTPLLEMSDQDERNSVSPIEQRFVSGGIGLDRRRQDTTKRAFVRFGLGLVIGLFILVFFWLSVFSGNAQATSVWLSADQIKVHTITVQDGDTLWNLAAEYKPTDMGYEEWIDEVKNYNELTSTSLNVGTVLSLP